MAWLYSGSWLNLRLYFTGHKSTRKGILGFRVLLESIKIVHAAVSGRSTHFALHLCCTPRGALGRADALNECEVSYGQKLVTV